MAAPIADLLGRLLAPTLLGTAPFAVVVLSPTDPHMLLAGPGPGVSTGVIALVLAARIGRAVAIYLALIDPRLEPRNWLLRRLVTPVKQRPWTAYSSVVAVVLLPGMAGAVVAARHRMTAKTFLAILVSSTIAGVAITLTAASHFGGELTLVRSWVTSNPIPATGLILAITTASVLRRLRRPAPVSSAEPSP